MGSILSICYLSLFSKQKAVLQENGKGMHELQIPFWKQVVFPILLFSSHYSLELLEEFFLLSVTYPDQESCTHCLLLEYPTIILFVLLVIKW